MATGEGKTDAKAGADVPHDLAHPIPPPNSGKVDLLDAKTIDLPSPGKGKVKPIDITEVGYDLAKVVLSILAVASLIIGIFIGIEEFHTYPSRIAQVYEEINKVTLPSSAGNGQTADTTYVANADAYVRVATAAKGLLDATAQEQKQSRDFLIQVAQLILLTLYLPILTALLGYIFGTRQ